MFKFDPASLIQVEAVNPAKAAKPRVLKAKPRFQAKVTEKGVRFHISAELSETLTLGMGGNGFNVLADNPQRDGFDPKIVALELVAEEGAQLLPKAQSRKSRNFAAHALATPLLAQGLIGTALGTYNFDLELVEGQKAMYIVVNDNREGISHELEAVEDSPENLNANAIVNEEETFPEMQEESILDEEAAEFAQSEETPAEEV